MTVFCSKEPVVAGSGGENSREQGAGGSCLVVSSWVANAHSPGTCAKATNTSETTPPTPRHCCLSTRGI